MDAPCTHFATDADTAALCQFSGVRQDDHQTGHQAKPVLSRGLPLCGWNDAASARV